MADFFDKLKESINKGVATASALTQELIDTTKIKSQISTLENQKRKAFEELGELTYEMFQNGTNEEEKLREKCAAIKEQADQIKSLEASIAQPQQTSNEIHSVPEAASKCSCGAELPVGVKFCGSCGKKIEAEVGQ
jgi:hypothetical protein